LLKAFTFPLLLQGANGAQDLVIVRTVQHPKGKGFLLLNAHALRLGECGENIGYLSR